MAQVARLNLRMQKELKLLLTDPPPGASFPFLSADSDLPSLSTIDAQIEGPEGTVYAKGIFNVKIQIPERYPFQAPIVTFATPIYHPNIDTGGRICLDILNLPPKGAWQPSLNISTVLTSIGLLMSEPNPDDGLMCEASREYKYNRQAFDQKARAMTEKYAKTGVIGHNCSTKSIQTNSDSSTVMEVKGSEKELKHEVNDHVSSNKKPSGINRKLSLESSTSTHKRENDGEKNGMPNHHPSLPFENHMEAKRVGKELGGMPDGDNVRSEKLCGTGRKLSLESSVQIHNRDNHDADDMEPKHSYSISNLNTVSMATSGSLLLQNSNHHEQSLHWHHDCESTNGSKSVSSKKLSQVGQKMPFRAVNACQRTGANDEKKLMISELSPYQSHSNLSNGPLPMSLSVNHEEPQLCKDSLERIKNGSSNKEGKNACPVAKKLLLGFKGSSQGQANDDKENIMPIHKFLLSNFQAPRRIAIGRKLSLGPLSQLQGSNENNHPLVNHSLNLSTAASKQQHTSTQDQPSEIASELNEGGEASPVAESVIVLDSEDSEEENNGSVRSNLPPTRRRIVKRKVQA